MSERAWGSRGRWFDAPIALVTLGWVAIWALWPLSPPEPVARHALPRPARFVAAGPIALHERPDLHVLPRIRSIEERAGADSLTPALPPPRPEPRRMDLVPVSTLPAMPPEPGIPFARRGSESITLSATRVLDGATLRTHTWHVWVSPDLQHAGLVLPHAGLASLPEPTASFEAVLAVTPSTDGHPAGPHIFIERATGSRAIDEALLVHVRRALAGLAQPVPYGTIVISHTRASGE